MWIIARTDNGCENLARAFLREQGIEVYFPVETARFRIRGRTRDVTRPVYRNYIFVLTDRQPASWARVRDCRGVFRILTLCGDPDGTPAEINAYVVDEIRALENSGEWDGVRKAIDAAKRKKQHKRMWKSLDNLKELLTESGKSDSAVTV